MMVYGYDTYPPGAHHLGELFTDSTARVNPPQGLCEWGAFMNGTPDGIG
jgi:hypothetical protein